MKGIPGWSGSAILLSCALIAHSTAAHGQTPGLTDNLPQTLFLHNAQGYLGVDLKEIDADTAAKLKLKEARGAEIVNLDHDAPACKAGLKAQDVILQMNGDAIQNVDDLRRLLHESSPGRTVTLVVSRDGNLLNFTLQLADRAVLQQQAWSRHFSVPEPESDSPEAGAEQGPDDAPRSGGSSFLGTPISRELYVGVDLNPVRAQLGDYFGVKNGTGLLVESVDNQSPAARAGLRAGDVILKVNSDRMASRNDWLRAIRTYRDRQVQLTVVRDKQLQILTMVAGESR